MKHTKSLLRRVTGNAKTGKILVGFALGLTYLANASMAKAVTFSVSGGQIKKDGATFVVKGTNIPGLNWYWDREVTQDANLIANIWKFNTVRVNCMLKKTDQPWQQHTVNNDLNRIVNAFTSRGVVVILEAHDHTGGYFTDTSSPSLTELSNWFKSLASTYKNNPYVWFNVMNEPGGQPYPEDNGRPWLNVHQRIIKDIREQGNNTIIIADGTSWGQDAGSWNAANVEDGRSAILSYGTHLLNFGGRSYSNIAFSIHVYEQWGYTGVFSSDTKIADYIQRVKNKGLTLLIGEYGIFNAGNTTTPATNSMWKALQGAHSDVGRIVWQWDGGDSNDITNWDQYFSWAGSGWGINKTDGSKPTNLNHLGNQVWDDNHSSATISGADLVVTDVKVQQASWNVNSTINFVITVKNQGNTSTSASWLGSHFYVDGSWVDWGGENATLAAGASRTFTSKGWTATKTNFQLRGLADYPNYYAETNESNNDKTVTISR